MAFERNIILIDDRFFRHLNSTFGLSSYGVIFRLSMVTKTLKNVIAADNFVTDQTII
jgi:hypothetical protein